MSWRMCLTPHGLSDEKDTIPVQQQTAAQFYSKRGAPPSTIVCIEVSHGPNHSGPAGMTKVCGPEVKQAVPVAAPAQVHQSQSRAADQFLLPNDIVMSSPLSMVMSRQAPSDSIPSCTSERHFLTRLMPNMNYDTGYESVVTPSVQAYSGPRMTLEATRTLPMPMIMEKSREFPLEFPAVMPGPMVRPMVFQQRFQTARTIQPNQPWMPLNYNNMNGMPMASRASMPIQQQANPIVSSQQPLKTNRDSSQSPSQETEVEKLRKACENKDKLLEERNTEIEELQKELSSAKRQPSDMSEKQQIAETSEPKVTKRILVSSSQQNDEIEVLTVPKHSIKSLVQKLINEDLLNRNKPADQRKNSSGWLLWVNKPSHNKIRQHHGRRGHCPNGMKRDHVGRCRAPWKKYCFQSINSLS
ncbi:hypothetical protein O3M35_010175 [Rhynocoris fuscipes]|uniref:Uncharacterized protein n=1 Tax=Rhynocoris fuscipes TaxID=488301 RepID=A0AAW1D087_9HEMI